MRSDTSETIHEIPYQGINFTCPACESQIPVVAHVRVKKGAVQKVGSSGFRNPTFSVSIDTEIQKFKIDHECVPKKETN